MGALIWFLAALVLAGLELMAGEFTLLMLAGAALATAGVALADVPFWLEAATFAVSSLALLVLVKPVLRRQFQKPEALDTSSKTLVGKHAEVLEPVDGRGGQIRLDGAIWSARSLDPQISFAEGEMVSVADIEGPTAIVWKN
ncbi:hypothetical protein C3B44_05545 [Corynebacterium yudongzhengii]|uniref:NfeD family protein n=1 Tax=Corynebacterium yudongzhengii TaxID=2080740 RepID=A0A2U1T8F1_9CORY|nr:NfeD family protein [Corynebacterium yudongzhengii]AWB81884.1 hypothetical protein C3B44_05545 [Corynebacterium yudongzhengii]PWC02276.1 NfeD family protein [Corynebacterium yudongzhengii]